MLDSTDLDADVPLDDGLLAFNGVNGSTGEYLLPPRTLDELARLAANGPETEAAHAADLKARSQRDEASYGVRTGVDPRDLAQTGWGVVFPRDVDPAVVEALRPLLDHRRQQAARIQERRYRELSGPDGYQPDESKNDFITRHGSAPGPVDPDHLPYYLLLVGDPETIPYSFQSQLDVPHAVGRIHFETVEEYAQYAHSVVAAETTGAPRPRRAAFFGVRSPGDQATMASSRYLIHPLASQVEQLRPGWEIARVDGQDAVKRRLAALLGGPETPGVLFTASHGLGFDNGDPRQLTEQGALLCSDWEPGRAPSPDQYFAASDVADSAALHGLIAFHFACFGAGTPRYDEYAYRKSASGQPTEIAPRALLSKLPRRLLAHPNGGALAVVGHVERAWGCSFLWGKARREQIVSFEEALLLLLDGYPIGAALEALNQRYAECATMLGALQEKLSYGLRIVPTELVPLWTATNDARGYAIVGDPAVRLAPAAPSATVTSTTAPASISTVSSAPRRGVTLPEPASAPTTMTSPWGNAMPEGTIPEGAMNRAPTDPSSVRAQFIAPPGGMAPSRVAALGIAPDTGEAALPYALVGADDLERLRSRLGGALHQLAEQLATALTEAATITVTTYASPDLSQAADGTKPAADARPIAVTRLGLLGDVELYLPPQSGAIDAVTWARHMDHVGGAQANRAALLAAAAEAAASLARLLRPI